MEIFNHLEEEHLYDDNRTNFTRRSDGDLVELSQGRSPEHLGRIHANVYYTFLTGGTLLIAYGIYKLYELLINSIWTLRSLYHQP